MEAKFYPLPDQVMDEQIDKIPELTKQQCLLQEQILAYKKEIDELTTKRKGMTYKITLEQMPDKKRYNKLKTESKRFMSIIKMICYRAESSMAHLLPATLKGEQRMCLKQMIGNNADLTVDYEKNTLTVTLHAMSAKRYNRCDTLNQAETIFPGTQLKIVFKTTEMAEGVGTG